MRFLHRGTTAHSPIWPTALFLAHDFGAATSLSPAAAWAARPRATAWVSSNTSSKCTPPHRRVSTCKPRLKYDLSPSSSFASQTLVRDRHAVWQDSTWRVDLEWSFGAALQVCIAECSLSTKPAGIYSSKIPLYPMKISNTHTRGVLIALAGTTEIGRAHV